MESLNIFDQKRQVDSQRQPHDVFVFMCVLEREHVFFMLPVLERYVWCWKITQPGFQWKWGMLVLEKTFSGSHAPFTRTWVCRSLGLEVEYTPRRCHRASGTVAWTPQCRMSSLPPYLPKEENPHPSRPSFGTYPDGKGDLQVGYGSIYIYIGYVHA